MSAGFRFAVPTGAGIRPLVLCIGNGRPRTVCDGMICVFIGAIPADGATNRSSVLRSRIVLPYPVGQTVRSGFGGAVPAGAGQRSLMLSCRDGRPRPGCCRVARVFI